MVKGILAASLSTALVLSLLASAANMIVQQAFAHALNFQTVEVEGAGERGVTIVLGHENEPAYGAKPGIHDGKHGVEVFLEDSETVLPITGASLRVDKYYFTDFSAFQGAQSASAADEIQRGFALGAVFGDPGHYVARQVQNDGIYGYRLYGNVSYFGVANVTVDTTVFCRSTEGNTTKFNSPGWVGGFGCTESIDQTLFPTRNNNVNSGQSRVTFEVPASNGPTVQQTSIVTTAPEATTTAATEGATDLTQLLTLVGIAGAGVTAIFAVRSHRHNRLPRDL
jgi:hypothetical protein